MTDEVAGRPRTSRRRGAWTWTAVALVVLGAGTALFLLVRREEFPARLWMPVSAKGTELFSSAAIAPDSACGWSASGRNDVWWDVQPKPSRIDRLLAALGIDRPPPETDPFGNPLVTRRYVPTDFLLPGADPSVTWQELTLIHVETTSPPDPEDVAGFWDHVGPDGSVIRLEFTPEGIVRGLPFERPRWGRHGDRIGVVTEWRDGDPSLCIRGLKSARWFDAVLGFGRRTYEGRDSTGAPVCGKRVARRQ